MKVSEAKQIIGSIGYPSKMPGTSYGLPAKRCITGSKLAKIDGTVCASCYANGKNFYGYSNTQKAQFRRLEGTEDPRWVEAMVSMLRHIHSKPYVKVDLGYVGVRHQRKGGSRFRMNATGFHRWQDSGDLQSVNHLASICEIAKLTPQIKHWLPTLELSIVKKYTGKIPSNLIIRISSIFTDDQHRRNWPHTSSVFTEKPPSDCYVCPAPQQGNECKSCRACWDYTVEHIAYHLH